MQKYTAVNLSNAINALMNMDIDMPTIQGEIDDLMKAANVVFEDFDDLKQLNSNEYLYGTNNTRDYFAECINNKGITQPIILEAIHTCMKSL